MYPKAVYFVKINFDDEIVARWGGDRAGDHLSGA